MMRQTWIFLLSYYIVTMDALPQMTQTTHLVVLTTTESGKETIDETKDKSYVVPEIYEMRIESNVSNRFAHTHISSKVKNLDKAAHETVFSVVIPDTAFISGFVMEINGKSYEAYIQEKEQAKTTYQTAVARGQAAGHVAVSARESNRFTVSVNIEPQSKVTFLLKYEELLQRQDEKYQIVLNIHPGQVVPNLETRVNIAESRPLKFVRTPSLRTGNEIVKEDEKLNPNAQIDQINKTSAVVVFNPNSEKQKQYALSLGTKDEDGLSGQFIVEYDVERDPQGGEILVDNGYFVHFFAPEDLPALPKQVVFVLDTSGSMEGTRIAQLKKAMKSILSELKKEDVFNILEFNGIAKVWNIPAVAVQYESGTSWDHTVDNENPFKNRTSQPLPAATPVSEENIKKAEQVVNKLNAYGGTDIETALRIGIQLVEQNKINDQKHQSLIIFLTDGEPTVGESNTDKIIRAVTELNGAKAPIFSLSFGDGADRKFLEKISLKNLGFARHIYEAADASLQLQEFYKQISSPLLSKVTFKYLSNVKDITKRSFPILFRGSELVVAGLYDEGLQQASVEGWGINGPVELIPKVETAVSSLERLWAYLTLKQILEQREQADNKTGPTQEALRLALKYSFVSDVSSLVVVKPNETKAVDTEDGSKTDKSYPIVPGGFPGIHSFGPYSSGLAALGPVSLSGQAFYQPVQLSEDIGVYPSVNRFSAHSTTPNVQKLYSTRLYKKKTPINLEIDVLKSKLPWLQSILNNNDTISLTFGTYELGLNETLLIRPDCNNSISNSSGGCVLINKCPQLYTQLPDQATYEKHFCEVEGYAGICCPNP